MEWTKAVVYAPIKKEDDVEIALSTFSNTSNCNGKIDSFIEDDPDEHEKPRRHLSTGNYQKLKHYYLYSVLVICSIIAQFKYLAYKFSTYYLHTDETMVRPWLIVLLLCECVYFVTSLLSAVDYLLPPSNRPDLGLLNTSLPNTPTVDVFIPCCKEPTEVPIESVKAALALDYPVDLVKVFVLDDGGDDDLQAFCNAIKVETAGRVVYIRREKKKDVPHNFKCGNMNNGLKYSNAEYVVMMDADMILHPSYLRRLLPHIVSSADVCFVQIPQAFYNLPIGDPLNDSCSMGYDRILPCRDSLGTAACVGTGALFRRNHLNQIGGFQPQSITEDTMTAFTLWNQGYESVYICEKLQIGLTPWTFEGYIKQRTRWGKGAIQQFSASARAFLGWESQLNFIQKILYFYHTGYYFLSFINVLLLGILLCALTFNWKLAVGTDAENLALVKYLATYLVMARATWFVVWLKMPQSVLMRNREESHFWWITPYFLEMCIESLVDFKSTYVFVPTSNIDKNAVAAMKSESGLVSSWIPKLKSQVGQVKYHVAFVITSIAILLYRISNAFVTRHCGDKFLVLGLSVFFISVIAHMMIPVMYIFSPPSFKPSQRKSLLRYSADGIPQFTPDDGVPKWSWAVIPYEVLAWTNLLFWVVVWVFVTIDPTGATFLSRCKT